MALKKLTPKQIKQEAKLTREDFIELQRRWQEIMDRRLWNLLYALDEDE